MFLPKKNMILELFGKQRKSPSFSLWRRKIHILHVKSTRESCKENYIGETKRNVITRWNQHENSNKVSELAKNLFQNPDHVFLWNVLMSALMNNRKRKNLEAFFITVKHPTLYEQKHLKKQNESWDSVDKRTLMSLTSTWLLIRFDWSKCCLLGIFPKDF